MTEAPAPLLELRHVARRFGSVVALHDVSLRVDAGAVTCLLGDNGAGKSTLIQIISGALPPTQGELHIDGTPVRLASPRDALRHGIATLYQDLAVVPLLSAWRNFFLGNELRRGNGWFAPIDVAACRRIAHDELAAMGIDLDDVDQPVATMSGGERQSLAMARALYFGARVLILDEPTAALGVKQTAMVLQRIRAAAARGVGVVFITHNPSHAQAVGDHFVVLRQGHVADVHRRGERDVRQLAELMAGTESA